MIWFLHTMVIQINYKEVLIMYWQGVDTNRGLCSFYLTKRAQAYAQKYILPIEKVIKQPSSYADPREN